MEEAVESGRMRWAGIRRRSDIYHCDTGLTLWKVDLSDRNSTRRRKIQIDNDLCYSGGNSSHSASPPFIHMPSF